MSVYAPDPGAVFASDAHRRVLGHLPPPGSHSMDVEDLLKRMSPDANTSFEEVAELADVLEDLEADGHVSQKDGGWRMLKKGFDAITGGAS